MSHTPGPWMLHAPGSMRACDGRHGSADGCRTIVEAEIVGVPRPEAEANARLISAAPELLAALKEMADMMEMLWEAVPWGQTFNLDAKLLNEAPLHAKAAIAKAEGATS